MHASCCYSQAGGAHPPLRTEAKRPCASEKQQRQDVRAGGCIHRRLPVSHQVLRALDEICLCATPLRRQHDGCKGTVPCVGAASGVNSGSSRLPWRESFRAPSQFLRALSLTRLPELARGRMCKELSKSLAKPAESRCYCEQFYAGSQWPLMGFPCMVTRLSRSQKFHLQALAHRVYVTDASKAHQASGMAQAPSVQQGAPSHDRALHWASLGAAIHKSGDVTQAGAQATPHRPTSPAPVLRRYPHPPGALLLELPRLYSFRLSIKALDLVATQPPAQPCTPVKRMAHLLNCDRSRAIKNARKPTPPCAIWNNRAVPDTHLTTQ